MHTEIVTREAWISARAELLAKEKSFTRAREELARLRRQLPRVRLEQDYTLVGAEGPVRLADVFESYSQLAVYHLMFGPGWKVPCSGCTQWANALNGTTDHFASADARLIAVSRAPYAEIAEQKQRLGWTFTWLSSYESDFNRDFNASSDDLSARSSKHAWNAEDAELVEFDRGENHGVSVFYRDDDGQVFHTYSAYNRGIEELNGAFGYYDLLPKGRAW